MTELGFGAARQLGTVDLRALQHDDLPTISRWLQAPHVRRWWIGEPTNLDAVRAKYGPCIDGTDPTEVFLVMEDDRPVGLVQRYLIRGDLDWARALGPIVETDRAAGIDYLIGETDALNRGLGTRAVQLLVPAVYRRWPVASIVTAVQQENRPSWRTLERAGFARIWAGALDSADPSDAGPAFLYRHQPDR